MMEDKVRAIAEWPTPKRVFDIRSFLGAAGYYRKFIRDFSALAAPLTELTKDRAALELGSTRSSERSIRLKQAMQSAPVLALPDDRLSLRGADGCVGLRRWAPCCSRTRATACGPSPSCPRR